MTSAFRFSTRPNRAHEIAWRPWSKAAFDEAEAADKPVMLNLSAMWCHWCHEMDETTLSDPSIINSINSKTIPIRVDADHHPHVQDRYIAGGWPTNAFLTPTGEVLWAGTSVTAADLEKVIDGVTAAWSQRRDEFQKEIEKRRLSLESTRARQSHSGLVRREAADDVVTALREAFDARNGGFGTEPKFAAGEAIELLYMLAARGDVDALTMADRTLDGMIAGDIMDRGDGGFFRYATSADWTTPRFEKLLEINAIQLACYAYGAHVRARPDWSKIAEQTVAWVERTLALSGGLWAGSQFADQEYFAATRAERGSLNAPAVDQTVYTSWNAMWIAALSDAGGRLGKPEWITRAANALDVLMSTMASPNGLMFHYAIPGSIPQIDYLLADAAETLRAVLSVYQSTGEGRWLETARVLSHAMEGAFWSEDGGFWDREKGHEEVAALRFRERPFELNARIARALLDVALLTGERGLRALAERTLAILSPQAGRFGAAGSAFALAVEDFFQPPPFIAVVGDPSKARAIREAALALPIANRRVWTREQGGAIGTQTMPAMPSPAAYACGRHGRSAPILDEAAMNAAAPQLT